jgi:hypothetical protein
LHGPSIPVPALAQAAGLFVAGSAPSEFGTFLKQDFDYQGRLMKEFDMKIR